ncbi:hypothetical protein [Ruania rhizosphaerae]|uniref:hypothetical protein n=1 Tax=Ruania rhizosphaerae TaxID=1840413 RepID=UPI001356AD7C|nr:hypothetical protein [Ruania rhizosphaerae]
MLAIAAINIAVVANMPFGFTDSMPFADIVNYTGFTTALSTWWGNPALPIVLSAIGALSLVVGAVMTDGFCEADQTGSMVVLGSLAATCIGSLGTVLATVLAVVAAIVSIAIAIAIGIAMGCAMVALLLGMLDG